MRLRLSWEASASITMPVRRKDRTTATTGAALLQPKCGACQFLVRQ